MGGRSELCDVERVEMWLGLEDKDGKEEAGREREGREELMTMSTAWQTAESAPEMARRESGQTVLIRSMMEAR